MRWRRQHLQTGRRTILPLQVFIKRISTTKSRLAYLWKISIPSILPTKEAWSDLASQCLLDS